MLWPSPTNRSWLFQILQVRFFLFLFLCQCEYHEHGKHDHQYLCKNISHTSGQNELNCQEFQKLWIGIPELTKFFIFKPENISRRNVTTKKLKLLKIDSISDLVANRFDLSTTPITILIFRPTDNTWKIFEPLYTLAKVQLESSR